MKLKVYVDDTSHALYWHTHIYTLVLYMHNPSLQVVVARTHAMNSCLLFSFSYPWALGFPCWKSVIKLILYMG